MNKESDNQETPQRCCENPVVLDKDDIENLSVRSKRVIGELLEYINTFRDAVLKYDKNNDLLKLGRAIQEFLDSYSMFKYSPMIKNNLTQLEAIRQKIDEAIVKQNHGIPNDPLPEMV